MKILIQFCNSCNSHIDLRYFIPCFKVNNAGFRETENILEFDYRISGVIAEDAVCCNDRNGSVYFCDAVELFLHLTDFIAAAADRQVIAGPRGRNSGDLLRRIYIHGAAVIIPDDFNWGVSLIAERFASPLAHPVRTGHPPAVTVLGQNRLFHTGPCQILVKDFIYDPRNAVENIPPVNPFMVIGGGRSDGKIIAFVAVPFCIHTVQCERHDGENICGNGAFRPGGIDFAGCHILYVVRVADLIIPGSAVRRCTIMNHNSFRYYDTAEYDFPAFIDRFYFGFRNLGGIVPV